MSNFDKEISFDIDKNSIENLKKALNLEQIEARSIRFKNGTETLDDLLNYIQHYKIVIANKEELDVVDFKYYQKMVNCYRICENSFQKFVKQVKGIRDKLEVMDYYGVPEAIEDLNKLLGEEE